MRSAPEITSEVLLFEIYKSKSTLHVKYLNLAKVLCEQHVVLCKEAVCDWYLQAKWLSMCQILLARINIHNAYCHEHKSRANSPVVQKNINSRYFKKQITTRQLSTFKLVGAGKYRGNVVNFSLIWCSLAFDILFFLHS